MKTLILAALIAMPVTSQGAISVIFGTSMEPIQQQTFIDAAAYWNSVIIGQKNIYNGSNAIVPVNLVISASLETMDDVGGTLGSAGPTAAAYYDNTPNNSPTSAIFYATTGQMTFDIADVTSLIQNNMFYGVVLHEMAHVLGIGTLWSGNNAVNGVNNNLYTTAGQYTGANGLAAWRDEFDQPAAAFVPVELGGGEGTAEGHWNEVDNGAGDTGYVSNLTNLDLRYELMTGWASNQFFVSTLTIGALEDLGYVVDYTKAGVINHTVVIPEPSTLALTLCVIPLLGFRRRRKA